MRRLDQPIGMWPMCVALLPVTLLLLLPVGWGDNEETKFLSAFRRVEPSAFPPHSAAWVGSSGQYLVDWVLGLPILAFGIEAAHSIARVAMATLYALGLSAFFSALRLSWLDSTAVTALFIFLGQHLFGGEWMFNGVEGKTIAYAAVLGAFGLALRDRWIAAAVLAIVAAYFHFLVGGFWALALAMLSILRGGGMRHALRFLLLVVAGVAPIIFALGSEHLGVATVVPASSLDPNMIYANLRNAHHIAPFANDRILWIWSDGLIVAAVLIVAFVVAARHVEKPSLHWLVVLLLVYLFVALAIAYVDRNTQLLGKFYLFRPTSLILFIALTLSAGFFRDVHAAARESNTVPLFLRAIVRFRLLTLVVIGVTFLWTQMHNLAETSINYRNDLAHAEPLVAAVKDASAPGEIVLIQPSKGLPTRPRLMLHRLIPRPTLVSFKFVPTTDQAILQWYAQIKFRRRLFREGCVAPLDYPAKLLVVFDAVSLQAVQSCGPVIWRGKAGTLVAIRP